MKKILMVAMAIIVAVGSISAQPKNSESAYWKMAKKQAKEQAKLGWILDGSKTLEMAYYEHYQKTLQGNYEITGNVIGATTVKTVNQGQQWATNMASISYAKQAGENMVKAIERSIINAGIDLPSKDEFIGAYQSNVEKQISGELIKSFGMYREKKDGGIEYKAFFTVSEEAATKARQRAFEQAKKEIALSLDMADEISKFVDKNFTPTAE